MTEERRKENKFILYTDIVGHTKMFGRLGAAFRPMRERHDELFQQAIRNHASGAIVQGSGDGFFCAIDDVGAAIESALSFRRALAGEDWGRFLPAEKRTPDNVLKARVGVHSGLVNVFYRDGIGKDFDGPPRNIAEKVMSMAVGNQVLVTRAVRDQGLLNLTRRDELDFKKFGEFLMRGLTDTVEVWGIGEPDMPLGPRPVQPPEHRVIVFATIHEFAQMAEKMGPDYDAMKDVWDGAFAASVEGSAKDAFVKRLPDGSLAAFKNAMEATRAALEFRRAFKMRTKNAITRIEPKIALDSGLVTFDYENNRPVDVRDQPVNIAAKVCKGGLAAPWQLILSRPVREDAYQNLPERDEFKWVCLGRKQVPGEPEPLELWDFQDIQQKGEHRALVLVDHKTVSDALRLLPNILAQFTARLNELVAEVNSRRTEEPWALPADGGLGFAFKDPVEAIQFAIDLRETAVKEQWERILTGFKRASRDDNLLKIAVSGGIVKLTYEDGLIREFKGAALDAARPLIDAAENTQVLVQRELKEAVAAAFPESDVKWRKIESTASGATPALDAFELRRGEKKSNKGLLVGMAGLALVALVAVVFALTRGPAAPALSIEKMLDAIQSNQPNLPGLKELGQVLKQVEESQKNKPDAAVQMKPVRDGLRKLADNANAINVASFAGYAEKLSGVSDVAGLSKWLDGADLYMPPRDGNNQILATPANTLPTDLAIRDYETQINSATGETKQRVTDEFAKVKAKILQARAAPWTQLGKAEHERLVAEARSALDKLMPEMQSLVGSAVLVGKPMELPKELSDAVDSDSRVMKELGGLVMQAIRAEKARDANLTDKQAVAKADNAMKSLAAIAKVKDSIDLDSMQAAMPRLNGLTMADTEKFLAEVPQYVALKDDPRKATGRADLGSRLGTLRDKLTEAGLSNDKITERLQAMQTEFNSAGRLPGVEKNRAEIEAKLKSVEASETAINGLLNRFGKGTAFGDAPWQRAVTSAVRAKRDEQLASVYPKLGTAEFASAADKAAQNFQGTLEAAQNFVKTTGQLVGALNKAYDLDETAPEAGKTVAALVTDVRGDPLFKTTDVATAMEPVNARLRTLATIRGATTSKDVLDAAKASRSAPEAYWASWKKLDEPLAGQDGFLEAVEFVQGELNRLSDVTDKDRRAAIQADAVSGMAPRWGKHFGKLTDPAVVKAAMIRRDRFGADNALLGGLSPTGRFNFRKWMVQNAIESALPEVQVRELVTALVQDPCWAALAGSAGAQTLKSALAGNGGNGGGNTGEIPAAELGPAKTGWKYLPAESGPDRAVYELPAGGNGKYAISDFNNAPPRLTFYRLQAEGQPEPSWVCGTELSAGIAAEVVARNRASGQLAGFYGPAVEFRAPLVWSRDSSQSLRIGAADAARKWMMTGPAFTVTPYYPAGKEPPAPTANHPMNYLTPSAAMFLARSLGSRLETTSEWRAAAKAEPDSGKPEAWNLRDESVQELLNHRQASKPANSFDPDIHIFPAQPGAADRGTLAFNDGFLWFARVTEPTSGAPGANRRFQHIVGNVAEMTYDDAAKAEEIDKGSVGELLAMPNAANMFNVIGGSALSRISDKVDVPIKIPNVATQQSPAAIRGFSDVGIRLAFTAKKAGGVVVGYTTQVLQAVKDAPYLGPAPK